MKIGIVVFDGFDELDAIGPYEVLQNAGRGGAPAEVAIVTQAPAREVSGSHGLRILPDAVLDDSYDLVIVPGGGWADQSESGAFGEIERGHLPAALRGLAGTGRVMASVCTGAMLLSAAGITRGRPATTHHAALSTLAAQGTEVVEARVVDDGDLVTAGGVTAGIDLALWLVEREWGVRLADTIAREMEYERSGDVWRGPDGSRRPAERSSAGSSAQTGAE